MTQPGFPPLPLSGWQPTRDILHIYSKVLGKVRAALTPRQKHWWHISLRVHPQGLTTTEVPFPGGEPATFEMILDLVDHLLCLKTSRNETREIPLEGQPASTFCAQALDTLAAAGIEVQIDRSLFSDPSPHFYDWEAIGSYFQAITRVDRVFKAFRAELPGETSPVQLWPHHFDLALMWLSGTKIPGTDPENEEYSDEQMAFGFSTGDEGIPDPYFYITAYPWQEGITSQSLPAEATWHTEGWKGALLMYRSLGAADRPDEVLLDFLRAGYQAWTSLEG